MSFWEKRQMRSLYKILAERNQKAKKYFQDCIFYAKEVKKLAEKFFKNVKVLIFGSVVRNNYRPDSDIDILIISPEVPEGVFNQAEIKVKIKEKFLDAPFELHLVTPEQYETWYKGFIKDDYIEV